MKKTALQHLMSYFSNDYVPYSGFLGSYIEQTHIQSNFNLLTPKVSITKYANSQAPFDTSNADVTDYQPKVIPVFDHVKTVNADTIFEPDEVLMYVASGVTIGLSTPTTDVTVVPGACTHNQTQPTRTDYINWINTIREWSLR